MADVARFWETWAPYLSYFEDNHLDLANIKKLDGLISDPVLIVGGGQGLLVEQLQKSGHKVDGVELSPQMIKYAQIRRGLKLIEADARRLPFPDQTYNTAIIATGVVDFLDDDAQIGSIVNEARRVTQASGKVLVGFVGVYPAAERFCRRIGLFTNRGTFNQRTLNQRKVFELTRLSPFETLKIFRRDYQLGVFAALREFLVLQMFLPRKEKKMTKKLAQMWKVVDNPQGLIDSAIESLPYRTEDEIRALFSRLRLPVVKLIGFGNCYVVQIGSTVQEVTRG
jgi:cyclopropane fatty-acyl-phospholipid synthase-like methyltransferase